MSRRNFNKAILNNTLSLYKKPREARNLESTITHFSSPKIEPVTDEMMENLDFTLHYWSSGDKFYKLAHKYYGDSKLWWVIAWFNQMPTEGFVSYGDVIEIPMPLEKVFQILGV